MTKNSLNIIPEPQYTKRRSSGLCVVAYCVKEGGMMGKYRNRFCHKHRREHQKYTNPVSYFFDVFRQNARRRKKEFKITRKYFEQFCKETNYLELKGKYKQSITIDRIRHNEGYIEGNLQILMNTDNVKKHYVDLKIRFGYYPTDEEIERYYKGSIDNACIPNKPEQPEYSDTFAEDDVPF